MIATIDARVRRALGRIRLAFRGRGSLINNAGPVMLVDGEGVSGEPIRAAELMQHYGFTSRPPAGFMYASLPIGGKTAHSIIVATEHGTYRLKTLKTGEMAIYSDEGDSIILKRGRVMEVTTQTFRVNAGVAIELNAPTITGNASAGVAFNTPLVTASVDIKAQGEVYDHGTKSMSGMRVIYNGHSHTDPQGGSVGTPSGTM